jgi:hypothetical protein
MPINSSAAYRTRGKLSFGPASSQLCSPIPVSGVEQWLMTLLQDLPKPSEYRFTADYSAAVADYCLANWLAARSAKSLSVSDVVAEFRQTMMARDDLSARQVDQLCNRTFSMQRELSAWLCDTTERFLTLIKPWTLVWLSFTEWALNWCRRNSIGTVVFLARDALPFFIAATALEQDLHLHLAHISRTNRPDPLMMNSILRQPSIALIDSGCYGTCINNLRQQRDALIERSSPKSLATLLYYSRNPQLFGYMNYVMCKDILASPKTMDNAAEFIIYAGDLLEALPKPYQYHAQDWTMVEPSDLLSFTISIAALRDISSMAKARALVGTEGMDDIHEQVRPLYRNYQISRHHSELRSDFLFDAPAPKSLPTPNTLTGLDFFEIPPQSHIFGTASG